MAGESEQDGKKYVPLTAEFENFEEEEVRREYRFSKPGKMAVQRCQKEMQKAPEKAFLPLVLGCVHPEERDALKADIEEYPGLAITFGNEILRRTGFDSLGK